MEPETTEKEPHRIFGSKNPNMPLWKDRVQKTNGGRARNITWESSVLKYIRPFREKAGWKTTRFCKEVVGAMRLMAGRYEQIKKVLDIWDGYAQKTKGQVFSLDRACDEAGVDRDEFAGLALAAVKQHFRMTAMSIVDLNIGDLVQASVDYASKDTKESSPERMRHLEKAGIIDKVAPGGTKVIVKQTANNNPSVPGRSFDSQMEEFDKVIDGEILGETKLIGDGQ